MSLTFAQLDQQQGPPQFPENSEEKTAAAEWYRSVYEIPLDRLSHHDMARACDWEIHREAVIPVALELLEEDIIESGMYNVELITSLIRIAPTFWVKHDSWLQPLKLMIQNGRDAFPPDVLKEAREFLVKVSR